MGNCTCTGLDTTEPFQGRPPAHSKGNRAKPGLTKGGEVSPEVNASGDGLDSFEIDGLDTVNLADDGNDSATFFGLRRQISEFGSEDDDLKQKSLIYPSRAPLEGDEKDIGGCPQTRFAGQLALMRRFYSWNEIPMDFFVDSHVADDLPEGSKKLRGRVSRAVSSVARARASQYRSGKSPPKYAPPA